MANRRDADVVKPMDPIALTLALWLGFVVCVTGLIRLSENAAAQAALAQASAGPGVAAHTPEVQPFSPRLMAFGG